MSGMTFSPFREVAIDALQVRQHRFPLASNLLPKPSSAQASRSCPNQLATKPLTPSNRGAVALTMSRRVRKVAAVLSSAAPFTIDPVQRIAARFASRADEPRSDSALPPAHDRHRPFLQDDRDLVPAGRDHGEGRGGPRERGAG